MVDRRFVLALAAEGDLDPRTAAKVLERGVDVVKGRNVRARAVAAMNKLGLSPATASSPQSPAKGDAAAE